MEMKGFECFEYLVLVFGIEPRNETKVQWWVKFRICISEIDVIRYDFCRR